MRTVVGVLRGGPSNEYDLSLQSGAVVLEALDKEKYDPRDLFISRDGEWHLYGAPTTPERALQGVDVAFNVIHGNYGEDGRVQRALDRLAVPYTGPDALGAALAFNKQRTKEALERIGMKMPYSRVIDPTSDTEAQALEIFRSFPHPAIVKPIIGGSSMSTTLADSYHALQYGLDEAFKVAPRALVEEFISGKEATVGVVDQFRGQHPYALMPVEITPERRHKFLSFAARDSGEITEKCPGTFSDAEKRELERLAKLAHTEMGLTHYSRSDFIVSKRGIYLLEVNSAAAVKMGKGSSFLTSLSAVGAKISEFVDHVVGLALKRNA